MIGEDRERRMFENDFIHGFLGAVADAMAFICRGPSMYTLGRISGALFVAGIFLSAIAVSVILVRKWGS